MRPIIITLLVMLSVVPSFAEGTDLNRLKEGDIIFVFSKSKQSPFIAYATGSLYTHCGIFVIKDGEKYVLEASDCVKLTPFDKFIEKARSIPHWTNVRITRDSIKIDYKKYLGKKYDLQFDFNNDKIYCSELVYLIYKEQFNIELCKPKQMKEYRTFGLDFLLKKRNMSLDSYVVAPSDLLYTKHQIYAPSLF